MIPTFTLSLEQIDVMVDLFECDPKIVPLSLRIALNPLDGDAYRERGLWFGRSSAGCQSICDLNRAIEINPDDYEAYGIRGCTYERWGNFRKARLDLIVAKQKAAKNADYKTVAKIKEILQDLEPDSMSEPDKILGSDLNLIEPYIWNMTSAEIAHLKQSSA